MLGRWRIGRGQTGGRGGPCADYGGPGGGGCGVTSCGGCGVWWRGDCCIGHICLFVEMLCVRVGEKEGEREVYVYPAVLYCFYRR